MGVVKPLSLGIADEAKSSGIAGAMMRMHTADNCMRCSACNKQTTSVAVSINRCITVQQNEKHDRKHELMSWLQTS